jgi:hypothetical protein
LPPVTAYDRTGGKTIWEPTREFIEQTNVWRFKERLGFSELEAFLRFSREEPERFWDELMREMRVEWFDPYRQVVDTSRGPEWSQWFLEGRLNIAHNCLDRWAGDPAASSGASKTVVSRLDRQFPNGGDPDVDRDRAQATGLKGDAPSVHGGLGEAGAGLQAVPCDELVQAETVHSPCDRG